MAYSTYASDGTTLTKESYTFSGTGQANGQELPWSALLTYDYSMANATGNLVDTIRTIAIYVGSDLRVANEVLAICAGFV